MMIKENSIIAVGSKNNKPDYDYIKDVSLLAYELKEDTKANAKVLDMKCNELLEVEVLKHENNITIESTGTDSSWTLILKDVVNVSSVNGATFEIEGNDTKILINSGNCKVICTLA